MCPQSHSSVRILGRSVAATSSQVRFPRMLLTPKCAGLLAVLLAAVLFSTSPPRTAYGQPEQQQPIAQPLNSPVIEAAPQQAPRRSERADAPDDKPEQARQRWWTDPEWWQVILTIAGAFVAYKAFRNEREVVLKTQRADMLITHAGFDPNFGFGEDAQVVVTVKNFGPTRANDVRVQLWLGLDASNVFEHTEPTPVVVAAGERILPRFPPLGQVLQPDALLAFVAGRVELQISGTIEYRDVFDLPHAIRIKATYHRGTRMFAMDENQSN